MMTCFSCFFKGKPSSLTTQRIGIEEEVGGAKTYSYRELTIATEDFNPVNKIGRGGFGSVYKGKLKDGSLVAVKVLSAHSTQGIREFLTEIKVISGVEHENLVQLHGCCVEGNHRLLVYGYLENNSLAQTLLGRNYSGIHFSWKIRKRICIGIARGLAYLHEEVQPHIVHRDIKASNILLDKDLSPKISDFGLAKLLHPSMTHISTRVAGTLGYLAPEYAIRGQLTRKADIYSFGILLVEIISGRPNTNKRLPREDQYLLERIWKLYEKGDLVELVDTALGGEFEVDEACKYLKVGLLCTQYMTKDRPSMSDVVKMLTGEMGLDDLTISKPGLFSELINPQNQMDNASNAESSSSGKQGGSSLPESTALTNATMTFTSIYDRST